MTEILIKYFASIVDIIRVVFRASWLQKPLKGIAGNRLVIIANGPSFSEVVQSFPTGFVNSDVLCVNSFPLTQNFTIYKPRYCVFVDPSFWDTNVSESLKAVRDSVFDAIIQKTDWDIYLFFPVAVRKLIDHKISHSSNQHVHVSYFNTIELSDGIPKPLRCFLYSRGIAIAGTQTVVNSALSLGISMRYSKIHLVGADATFLEDIEVDQTTNILVRKDFHFYDNPNTPRLPIYSDLAETTPMKVHEYLFAIGRMFKSYHECNLFAKWARCSVINSSKGSWIDAFPRGEL